MHTCSQQVGAILLLSCTFVTCVSTTALALVFILFYLQPIIDSGNTFLGNEFRKYPLHKALVLYFPSNELRLLFLFFLLSQKLVIHITMDLFRNKRLPVPEDLDGRSHVSKNKAEDLWITVMLCELGLGNQANRIKPQTLNS